MLSEEEECPVEESVLGELYRASPLGFHALVGSVPAKTRASLAHYCLSTLASFRVWARNRFDM
jgi:hypothetical protein